MANIFISYKRVDKETVVSIVERIQNDLKETCWMDFDEIESDAQFASVIMNAIDEAKVFLFMYSKAHTTIDNFDTDWTIRELNYAQEKKKRIVFVNLDVTPLANWFVFMFPLKQQVNAQSKAEMEKLIRDISQWLQISIKESSTKKSNTEKVLAENPIQQGVLSSIYDDVKTRLVFSVLDVSFIMIRIANRTYIGETPVTQLLWDAVMHDNPSRFKGEDNPVDSVSWNDCQCFINRLNKLTEKSFRLPTEAEWEFAAKGGVMSRNYYYSGSDSLDEIAWNLNNSENRTHPVKQKKANELGLFDMSGNVWEWCNDQLEGDFDMNHAMTRQGLLYIYKGGCWCETDYCRPTTRKAGLPNFKSYGGLGFRLAMTI